MNEETCDRGWNCASASNPTSNPIPTARWGKRRGAASQLAIQSAAAATLEALDRRVLLSAGTLDSTFGTGGKLIDLSLPAATAVAVQSDGKIVEAGSILGNLSVARFNADGTPDNSFGYFGRLITDLGGTDSPASILVQPDGKIDVFATSVNNGGFGGVNAVTVVRYEANGQVLGQGILGNFGISAISETPRAGDTVVGGSFIPGGGLMVFAQNSQNFGSQELLRYTSTGALDTTFGNNGVVQYNGAGSPTTYLGAVAQPDGKLIAVGSIQSGNTGAHAVRQRFNTDGTKDVSFSNPAISGNYQGVGGVGLGTDGKIVAVGSYGTIPRARYIARFNTDGSPDATFGDNGVFSETIGTNAGLPSAGEFQSVIEQADGKVVVSIANQYLERFNSNGTLDMTFGFNGVASAPQALSLTAGPNGTTVVNFGQTALALERFTGDGDIVMPPAESPYGGTPSPFPGVIQAENFDNGGEGVGYHSSNPTNYTGNLYRTSGITIENSGDTGGGYNVGFLHAGDYLNYTVNVTAAGRYNFQARVADAGSGATFHFEIDGVRVNNNSLIIPDTGGYQTYQSTSFSSFVITAGQHVVRLVMDTNNAFGYAGNFNSFEFNPFNAPQSTGSISGAVYRDLNGNGMRDGNEPGYAGAQVYLDVPGIGHIVPTDPVMTTDASGNYTFTALPAANYIVRLVPITSPAPLAQTQPGAVFAFQYYTPVADAAFITGKDFGVN